MTEEDNMELSRDDIDENSMRCDEVDPNQSSSAEKRVKQVYLPGIPLEEGEELVCDESAYVIYRQVQTGSPCLSFDVIPDELGDNRSTFPMTCYIVAGTQAPEQKSNRILLLKLSNLNKTQIKEEDDDDECEDGGDDEEDEDRRPNLEHVFITHYGCVNRLRNKMLNNTLLTASWSEMGRVNIWDMKKQLQAVQDSRLLAKYIQDKESVQVKPLFTFSGHQSEGYGLDWSDTIEGMLASGDCRKGIHIWHPQEGGWRVDQRPLIGHTASVEDLQWSPNERHVLCSASVDKSLRIWDTRASADKACMITMSEAHESDVNVISWNRNEPFIVSGGDDGYVHVWDLRQCQSGSAVATFKHHTAPVTTVEWHPTESTVFASGGSDNQIALWDLSLERDEETSADDVEKIPPQLLFIHQGQNDIKELHWHKQIPGLIISTALNGFNIFKTISV